MRDHEGLKSAVRARAEGGRGEVLLSAEGGWVAGDGRIMIEGGACSTPADLSLQLTAGKS